jgi:hypothetical protein
VRTKYLFMLVPLSKIANRSNFSVQVSDQMSMTPSFLGSDLHFTGYWWSSGLHMFRLLIHLSF